MRSVITSYYRKTPKNSDTPKNCSKIRTESFYCRYIGQKDPLRKKASFSAASAQLRSCRKASQKLRKSRRYWHLRKSQLLRRAAEKPAFTKLLSNSAEKLQKSQLFCSFYEAFTQSFVKIVMMSKSCRNAAITQVPIQPAFAKLLRRPA